MTLKTILNRYRPLYAPEAGAGGGDAAGAAKPWHDGVDAETIGHWQNKGWKTDDAKDIAINATKQARELEKHFGVPPDQLLKLPKADARPEDWAAFHQRLGAPKEAKEYDFSTVKMNGEALSADLDAAMRNALAQAFVPKDRATGIAAAVAKAMESARTAEDTVAAGKLAEDRATLEKNWGPKGSATHNFNLLKAMEGARRLGPEFVTALEKAEGGPGYAAIMEGMRKIGIGTSEDTFIERGTNGSGGTPSTREGAVARKAELMADKDWGARFIKGGTTEVQEMNALNVMIDGGGQ